MRRVNLSADAQADFGWRQRVAKERFVAARPPPRVDPFAHSLATLVQRAETENAPPPAASRRSSAAPSALSSAAPSALSSAVPSALSCITPSAFSCATPSAVRSTDASHVADHKLQEMELRVELQRLRRLEAETALELARRRELQSRRKAAPYR
ncbi:hypothetical protein AB1Y20_016966 [Prymnesium parvum]|uniref:Uncharacterized protein n=1 Tax=Prymnesium parvum TaxID=97485 RepID=A0AB34ICW3_PRYPA